MRSLVFLLVSFLVVPVFSATNSSGLIECKKDGDILKVSFDEGRNASAMSLESLLKKGQVSEYENTYGEILKTFLSILKSSQKCNDLSDSISWEIRFLPGGKRASPKDELFVCDNEMFAPQGVVYGQMFFSSGAISVFKDSVAPAAGWSCDLFAVNSDGTVKEGQ